MDCLDILWHVPHGSYPSLLGFTRSCTRWILGAGAPVYFLTYFKFNGSHIIIYCIQWMHVNNVVLFRPVCNLGAFLECGAVLGRGAYQYLGVKPWSRILWCLPHGQCCWQAAWSAFVFITPWLFHPIPPASTPSRINGTWFIHFYNSLSALNPEHHRQEPNSPEEVTRTLAWRLGQTCCSSLGFFLPEELAGWPELIAFLPPPPPTLFSCERASVKGQVYSYQLVSSEGNNNLD